MNTLARSYASEVELEIAQVVAERGFCPEHDHPIEAVVVNSLPRLCCGIHVVADQDRTHSWWQAARHTVRSVEKVGSPNVYAYAEAHFRDSGGVVEDVRGCAHSRGMSPDSFSGDC